MTYAIAVAGKGGTGKTSITGLAVRYLKKHGSGPILAVDADPNANLGEALGLAVPHTIGGIIATFNDEKMKIPPGMTKEAYLEIKLNGAMVEDEGLDLVTMGRGEGADCYCYPNLVLRKFIDSLTDNYAYLVMDNEAGMEHLSRRTTERVDELLLISDHSIKGVRTIARIRDLVAELKLAVKRLSFVINYVPDGLEPAVSAELARLGIELAATVPLDEAVREYDLRQKSLLDLPDTSPAVVAVDSLMAQLMSGEPARLAGG